MSVEEFVVKYFVKAYENLPLRELCDAPVSAISGVSEADAADLEQALRIRTVSDLADNIYVHLAQAINDFSHFSGTILNKEFQAAEFEELRNKPITAISGISMGDAALLKRAFGIDTIAELAENKYVEIAQLVTIPVHLEEMLENYTC